MKLTLTGPTDEGLWCLCDEFANEWLLVEKWSDYPGAAALLGWIPCDSCDTDGTYDCEHKAADQMIEEARQFLLEHIGEEFDAPKHIADFFLEMQRSDAEEVVTDFGDGIRLQSRITPAADDMIFEIETTFEFDDE